MYITGYSVVRLCARATADPKVFYT